MILSTPLSGAPPAPTAKNSRSTSQPPSGAQCGHARGLNRRDRSLLNIGMLVALRATEELRGHVRGALTNGLTREEITETIIHSSGYCGAPAALSAMKVAQQVLEEELGPRESSTESDA